MSMVKKQKELISNDSQGLRRWTAFLISYALLFFFSILTIVVTYLVYQKTQGLLETKLQERLLSTVTTASLLFDPVELMSVRSESDVGSSAFLSITNKLIDIRNQNNDIRFVYLLRPTENANIFEFIGDSHSINPYAEIDLDGDGIIDDSDALVFPGDEYDASEALVLVLEAPVHPSVDNELIPDQWGMLMAAYAPIKLRGETVGILGIDVDVSDYIRKTRATLFPFVLLIVFLLLTLGLLTSILVGMWESRVELFKELDRQKDELLSIVSHQMATPVSAMKWYLEMMLDGDVGDLKEKQKEHVQTIQTVAEDLVDLVSMILDVSRIQLGRMKVDRSEVDLQKLFNEVLALIEPKAKEKNITFTQKIPQSLPTAMLDKRLMRMTLENLLSNAVKYTPEHGEVTLTVSIQNEVLHYEVKDTGCGIPKAEQVHMFEKLFRASNVQHTEGNGFGLFAAKGAVEAQGGVLQFRSAEGKGTVFIVDVPLKNDISLQSGKKK